MRMTVELFALQSSRVRRVIDYIGTRLDEDITLARLAELACLSPSQLDRLYRSKVRETPMATLRRLRLKRALAQIHEGRMSLTEIGQFAGYGSAAAFNHAFVRQFGCAPSRALLQLEPAASPPGLYLEHLPVQPVFQIAYHGRRDQQREATSLLVGNLAVAGARRWRTWAVLDRDAPLSRRAQDQVDITHFVPAQGQPWDVSGVDRAQQGGGLYAVRELRGDYKALSLLALTEQLRAELGCVLRDDRRIVAREIRVNGYTAPQERHTALYLPVAPLDRPRRVYG